MAKIAYILLCHKDPEGIIAQANRLTAAGDFISIHFDARAKAQDFEKIRTALACIRPKVSGALHLHVVHCSCRAYNDRGIAAGHMPSLLRAIQRQAMSTTGKSFARRTRDKLIHRVLDAHTKAVLNAVMEEPKGSALSGYLRALGASAGSTRKP